MGLIKDFFKAQYTNLKSLGKSTTEVAIPFVSTGMGYTLSQEAGRVSTDPMHYSGLFAQAGESVGNLVSQAGPAIQDITEGVVREGLEATLLGVAVLGGLWGARKLREKWN